MDRMIAFKLAVGLACAAAMVMLLLWRRTYALRNRSFNAASMAGLAASRLGLFAVVFLVLRESAQSDVLVYVDWTHQLMAGHQLYSAECQSCYAPLFHYITWGLLWLWDSPLSIVLFGIICEAVALPIWIAIGRALFNERVLRQAMVIYLASPVVLWGVALGGQNQTWVGLLLALATWLIIRGKEVLSGTALAVSTTCVKFLPLMYAPALGLAAPWPWGVIRWTVGFVALNALIYGLFWLAGVDVLFVIDTLSEQNSSGNLPFMASLFGIVTKNPSFQRISDLLGVAILGILCLWLLVRTAKRQASPGDAVAMITAIHMLFMLVSKKSHNSYLIMVMAPVALTIAAGGLRPWTLAMFTVYTVVSSIEQSFWFRTMQMSDFAVLYRHEESETKFGTAICFLCMQLVVLWFYVWSFGRSWRTLRVSAQQFSLHHQPVQGSSTAPLSGSHPLKPE